MKKQCKECHKLNTAIVENVITAPSKVDKGKKINYSYKNADKFSEKT
jgi:hypothetical protein